MNVIDIIIISIAILSFIQGFRNGIIKEIGNIIGIVLGLYIALNFTGYTIKGMEWVGISSDYSYEIGFVITIIAVIITISILSNLLTKLISAISLSTINRILGGLICTITSVLIMSLLLEVLISFNNKINLLDNSLFEESNFNHILNKIADTIFPFVNDFIRESKETITKIIS